MSNTPDGRAVPALVRDLIRAKWWHTSVTELAETLVRQGWMLQHGEERDGN